MTDNSESAVETKTGKGKEIKIPGPDHPSRFRPLRARCA